MVFHCDGAGSDTTRYYGSISRGKEFIRRKRKGLEEPIERTRIRSQEVEKYKKDCI